MEIDAENNKILAIKGKRDESESEDIDLLSSGDEKTSMKSNQDSINARIRNMSQSTSVNEYNSDLFDDSSDEEKTTPKTGDYDLQDLFGVKSEEKDVNHDLTTAEGKFFFDCFFTKMSLPKPV